MTKERNALKAGLFIIISVALTIAIIVAIEGFDNLLQPSQTRTVTFSLTDNLGGLGEGDEVRVGGVRVGKIKRIEPIHEDGQPPRLEVRISIPGKYKLREGAFIAIETSVTGASDLNISDLGSGAELAKESPITGHPSALNDLLAIGPELRKIVGKTGPAIDSAKVAIDNANTAIVGFKETGPTATGLLRHVDTKVDPGYKKYEQIADAGTHAFDETAALFGEGKPDFRGTLRNLNVATGSLKEKLPGILDGVQGSIAKLQGSLDNVTAALEDIKQTANNTKDLTASARGVLLSNRTKFDGMIASIKAASDNLKAATSEIRRSPWRLLYKPTPSEQDNLLLFNSAREFAEGANDLNDAVGALRDAIHSGDTPPDELQKMLDQLERVFGKFNTVEQKLWKDVKD
jgi:ABC-type transporter Mla subunit MlaD